MQNILILTMLFLLFSGLSTFAAESKDRVFTNDDLNKTSSVSATDSRSEHRTIIDSDRGHKRISEKNDQERWCKRGTKMHNRVDMAKSRLDAAESKFRDDESKTCIRKKKPCNPVSNKKAVQARNNFKKAERELRDLEQHAHRRGIPPGWLQCQFSY